MSADPTPKTTMPTLEQRAACRSIGTKQCAAICLSHSCYIPLGQYPSAVDVWTPKAIKAERQRRASGPLMEVAL